MIAFYLKRNISLIKFLDGVPLPAHPEQNLRLGGRGGGENGGRLFLLHTDKIRKQCKVVQSSGLQGEVYRKIHIMYIYTYIHMCICNA